MTACEATPKLKEILKLEPYSVRGFIVVTETLGGQTKTRIVPLAEADSSGNTMTLRPMIREEETDKRSLYLLAAGLTFQEINGNTAGELSYCIIEGITPIRRSTRQRHQAQNEHFAFCDKLSDEIAESYADSRCVKRAPTILTGYYEESPSSGQSGVVEQTQTAFYTERCLEDLIIDFLRHLNENGMLDKPFDIPTPENTEA